ncbi:hypothetical protein TNCV_1053931 [Trichonephila clavipes]|nr:hypothetical protein TNCV_1053931 [Trichonephila clavipes]
MNANRKELQQKKAFLDENSILGENGTPFLSTEMPKKHYKNKFYKGRNEVFTPESPHTNTIVITAEIESEFVAKDDQAPFRCSPVSSCLAPIQTLASICGRHGRLDPKFPSARRLRMVGEDTWASSEGTTCVLMAADEAVDFTHAFLTMRWSSSMTGLSRVS